jgi:hypothetical protein
VHVSIVVIVTTNGTAAGNITASLPFAAGASSVLPGKEVGLTAKTVCGSIGAASDFMTCHFYDASYPGGDGAVMIVGGTYEGL